MSRKLISLVSLLIAIAIGFSSTAYACNCGCSNCAKAHEETNTVNQDNEKLLCEAPKDWLSLFKQLEQKILKTNVVCNADCNLEGGRK